MQRSLVQSNEMRGDNHAHHTSPCSVWPDHIHIGHKRHRAGKYRHDGVHDGHNPHIELTPVTHAAAGDIERAQVLADRVRGAIMQYEDVRAAEADDYRRFGPATLPEVHYVNRRLSRAERSRINPEAPGSLLYAPRNGGMELVGAMFTAPHGTSLAELNARVPLSEARWHLHVNICLPRPVFNRSAWR